MCSEPIGTSTVRRGMQHVTLVLALLPVIHASVDPARAGNDPCDGSQGEVIYNNSAYDEVSALTSQNSGEIDWIVSYTADDFDVADRVTVTDFHWYTAEEPELENDGTGDFIVLADNGECLPDDDQIIAENNIAVLRIDTGNLLYGYYPIIQYTMNQDISVTLDPGKHWVGLRPVVTNFKQSWWMTATFSNCNAVLKSEYFGYPDWTSWRERGYITDAAFCVTGSGVPCEGFLCADSNGDGSVDFDDIDCFVQALIGPSQWEACGTAYRPEGYACANDINGDGSVDFNDIDGFVQALIDGECP